MTAVVVVPRPRGHFRGGNLNMRQLLNPLFFAREVHHPDMTRQRSARRRAKDLAAARKLKHEYVPLCYVDRTVYLERFDICTGNWCTEKVCNA